MTFDFNIHIYVCNGIGLAHKLLLFKHMDIKKYLLQNISKTKVALIFIIPITQNTQTIKIFVI